MKQIRTDSLNLNELQNSEDVKVYRLHLLEENQVRILQKIETVERKLDENYINKVNDHETRIQLLEECCANYTRLKWVIIGEALILVGAFIKSILGV